MLNIKAVFVKHKLWFEYIDMLKQKKLDVLLNIVDKEKRHKYAKCVSHFMCNPMKSKPS